MKRCKVCLAARFVNIFILQFLVNNRQLYKLERGNAISRCILPGSVDLDVNTYLTISPQVSLNTEMHVEGSLYPALASVNGIQSPQRSPSSLSFSKMSAHTSPLTTPSQVLLMSDSMFMQSGRIIYHEDVWNNKGFGCILYHFLH